MHGHVDATLLLADENPDIEAQDRDGRTPLHLAAEKGHVDVIQRLLSNRANRAAKDNYGKYALNLAAGNGHTEAVMILTDTGKFEVEIRYLVYVRKFVQDNFSGIFNANDSRVKIADDSGSMHTGNGERIHNLRVTLQRITEIALTMHINKSGITIRFLNYEANFDNMNNTQVVKERVEPVFPSQRGGSAQGATLRKKVMKPLIYDKGQIDKGLVVL